MSLIFCQQLIWKIWESKVETEIYPFYSFFMVKPQEICIVNPIFQII